MTSADLVIVGGGPAALAAAKEAARAGIGSIIVVDDNRALGGQYYRRLPGEFRVVDPARLGREYAEGDALLASVTGTGEPAIQVLTRTTVWGLLPDEGVASLADAERSWSVASKAFILAAGAYDRPVAFPGWTLPGVMTAGGAQILLKAYQVLPGRRVLVAGSGPLLLALTKQLLDGGAEVVAVAEARPPAPLSRYLRHAPALWGNGGTLLDGWRYLGAMRSAGVPYLTGHTIVSAHGTDQVDRATTARLDERSRPIPGSERIWPVDAVCLGYGFLPSTELANACGCELEYAPAWGCYVPKVSSWMETSAPGVFAVGDVAGIRGVEIAKEQGRLAALAVAQRLGTLSAPMAEARSRPIRRRLARLLRFRKMIDELYAFDPDLCANLVTPDTVVCRCEEITAAEIHRAIAEGARNVYGVKMRCQAGMGPCQGRNCSPVVTQILARHAEIPQPKIEQFQLRPTVRPVSMGVLAAFAGTDAAPAPAEDGGPTH